MSHYNGRLLQLRPNLPPLEWVQKQARRQLAGYYVQLENLDWNIGRIRKVLGDNGLQFNTYMFLFVDHGDMMGSHGAVSQNHPAGGIHPHSNYRERRRALLQQQP